MIYLDNAATSFPKPREVVEKTLRAVSGAWGNPGRSAHPLSQASAEAIYESRCVLASLIGLDRPENIVFTSGATAALNLAILGAVEALQKSAPCPLVVSSYFEHNSVLRPLYRLERMGAIRLHFLPPFAPFSAVVQELLSLPVRLMVLSCRSNLTGFHYPLVSLAKICQRKGILLISDGAQALGSGGFTFSETGAHILCFAGHKGLFGLMGSGFLAISPQCPLLPEAILSGGSGNDSANPSMPDYLPERLEAGTLPLPAILSMKAGAEFLLQYGVDAVLQEETERKKQLTEGLSLLSSYELYDPYHNEGPLLINHKRMPSFVLEQRLAQEGIYARSGFHCAPLGHEALQTGIHGALRLSPGLFTTKKEISQALFTLSRLAQEGA